MLTVGNEKPSQVIQRLKRANQIVLMELEELLLQLKTKCKSKLVVGKIEQMLRDGKKIRSIEDLGDSLND